MLVVLRVRKSNDPADWVHHVQQEAQTPPTTSQWFPGGGASAGGWGWWSRGGPQRCEPGTRCFWATAEPMLRMFSCGQQQSVWSHGEDLLAHRW